MKNKIKIIRNSDEIPNDMTEEESTKFWSRHALSKELLDEIEDEEVRARRKNDYKFYYD